MSPKAARRNARVKAPSNPSVEIFPAKLLVSLHAASLKEIVPPKQNALLIQDVGDAYARLAGVGDAS